MKNDARIFLSPPHLAGNELEYVARALDSGYLAPVGPDVSAFEAEMAEYLGGDVHCVALSSGTAAIHLALLLSGVVPGDMVLGSDLTFVASANPVLYCGAEPVFVDAAADTWNLDPEALGPWLETRAARALPMPRALVLVHLYGRPADVDAVAELCARHGIVMIEDAAESLGGTHQGRRTGSLARFGVLSFNGNKVLTASMGGMLACRAAAARSLAGQAREPSAHYEHRALGYSYGLSNVCAAIGRAQLATLDERLAQRHAVHLGYRERLAGMEGIAFMPEPTWGKSNDWLTCLTFLGDVAQAEARRDRTLAALNAADIEARPVWKPMHLQPVFRGREVVGLGPEPGSVGRDLFRRGMCLPSGSQLTGAQLDRICEIVLAHGRE